MAERSQPVRRRVAPARTAAARPGWRRFVYPALVFVTGIGAWYLMSSVVLAPEQRFLLPPPHRVAIEGFVDAENRAELLGGLWSTARVAGLGFVIANVLGVAFAIVMRQAKWLERSVFPYLVVVDTIPTLALVPLVGFWLDFGLTARITVAVAVSLFPIASNTLLGLRSTDPRLSDLFRLHRAGRWTRLFSLELPGALPHVFAGLKIGAPLAVIAAIVSEFFFRQGDAGIGRLISIYRRNLDTEELIAAVILASLLGLAAFGLVSWAARVAVGSWHESARHARYERRRRGTAHPGEEKEGRA